MIHKIVYSCAGTTQKVADAIASHLEGNIDDLTIVAVPVWGGRVPAQAAETIRQADGHGRKAIAVVVYGNRDYDDALLELVDLLRGKGFTVIAAAAFVAEHCIFPGVATGRPDAADMALIEDFSFQCINASGEDIDAAKIKGKRPYKKPMGVPFHPATDLDKCLHCGQCVRECPSSAIASDTMATDGSRCNACSHCIAVCRQGARSFSGLGYKIMSWGFGKMCARRREPEWFI